MSAVNREALKPRRTGWIVEFDEVAVRQERGKTGGGRDEERRVARKG